MAYIFLTGAYSLKSSGCRPPNPGERALRFFFEDYSFDTDRRELQRGADVIPVASQVFDLLEYRKCVDVRSGSGMVTKADRRRPSEFIGWSLFRTLALSVWCVSNHQTRSVVGTFETWPTSSENAYCLGKSRSDRPRVETSRLTLAV